MMYLFVYVPVAGRIAPARSSKVKLPLPPRPTCSNKFRMDSAYPILFKGKYNRGSLHLIRLRNREEEIIIERKEKYWRCRIHKKLI